MADNPPITTLLRAFTILEAFVLAVVGFSLFVFPDWTHDVWAWELTPFNTRFLAAIYLASFVSVGSLAVIARWAPGRVVTPMILLFTTLVLFVSLTDTGRFETDRLATAGWWILYIVLPLNSAYFLWKFRGTPPALAQDTPRLLGGFLVLEALVMGVYGLLMLIAPTWSTSFWPWPIDAFHGRLYSAVFLVLALGALLVCRYAARNELGTFAATQITFGVFAIAGLLIVDADLDKVDWSATGTWVWTIGMGAIALMGAWLAVRAATASE